MNLLCLVQHFQGGLNLFRHTAEVVEYFVHHLIAVQERTFALTTAELFPLAGTKHVILC